MPMQLEVRPDIADKPLLSTSVSLKIHPRAGGNKRTATAITDEFLFRNGYKVTATPAETVEMVLAVEGDRWGVDEVESWLRERAKLIPLKVQSND